MANWKFTDDYGTQFPGLINSVLDILVFSDHTISGTSFTGTLDFAATGNCLTLFGQLLNVTSLNLSGTLSTDSSTFSLSLQSSGTLSAQGIPVIGNYIKSVGVSLNNTTAAADDSPTDDEFDLNLAITSGSISGTFVMQIPLTFGSFSMSAVFENVGVSLSDLDFLLPSGNSVSTYFPSNNPFIQSIYTLGTTPLYLLEIDLMLYAAQKDNSLSISVISLGIELGLINIPIYNNALLLNPLAVYLNFNNWPNMSSTSWSIYGTLALYPYTAQTNPPTAEPDFSLNVGMSIPIGTTPFSICGTFDNPDNQPVSRLLQDLFGAGYSIGAAADNIILAGFDVKAAASPTGGAISSFSMDVELESAFGLFATPGFGIKEFAVSFSYSST